jgi:hypothetical protein
MIYAHNKPRVSEDNEQNNCGQQWEYYFWQQVPSLSIERIECSPDNKLSVTLILQPAVITGGPWEDIWEAEGKVYFDGEEIGVFDIRNPTAPEDGIDSYSYSRYTYILPWEINAPVMASVVIYTTATAVEVSGWTHYPSSRVSKEELIEPMSYPSTNPSDTSTNTTYLPPLLGFIGLGIVLLIGYQRFRKRLFSREPKT